MCKVMKLMAMLILDLVWRSHSNLKTLVTCSSWLGVTRLALNTFQKCGLTWYCLLRYHGLVTIVIDIIFYTLQSVKQTECSLTKSESKFEKICADASDGLFFIHSCFELELFSESLVFDLLFTWRAKTALASLELFKLISLLIACSILLAGPSFWLLLYTPSTQLIHLSYGFGFFCLCCFFFFFVFSGHFVRKYLEHKMCPVTE